LAQTNITAPEFEHWRKPNLPLQASRNVEFSQKKIQLTVRRSCDRPRQRTDLTIVNYNACAEKNINYIHSVSRNQKHFPLPTVRKKLIFLLFSGLELSMYVSMNV
jgi:hypothetical protein